MRWLILLLIVLAVCGGEHYARAMHLPGEVDSAVHTLQRRVQHLEEELQQVKDYVTMVRNEVHNCRCR